MASRKKEGRGAFLPILFTFLLLYFAMNYYVISSYYGYFSLLYDMWLYIFALILTFLFLLAMILESYSDNIVFRGLYVASSILMGATFISMFVVTFFNAFYWIFGLGGLTFGVLSLSTTIVLSIYALYNAHGIRAVEIPMHNKKNINMRIVQISDLHLGPVHGKKYLEKVVKKVNKLNPELVLMTGDLLDGRFDYDDKILEPLNDIRSDVYFVHGNHDVYAGLDLVGKLLGITKVRWLRNERVLYGDLEIIGIDDAFEPRHLGGMLYSMNMHKKIGDKFTILMTHRPVGWTYAVPYADLMIAGHTHAGQIWPFTYLAFLENGATKGIYRSPKNNRFMLYVNCGTGTWGPPMRIGSRSEITVFNIKRENYP